MKPSDSGTKMIPVSEIPIPKKSLSASHSERVSYHAFRNQIPTQIKRIHTFSFSIFRWIGDSNQHSCVV